MEKSKIWLPKHTLLLVSATVLSYFALSGGLPYIPNELIPVFGFSLYSPLGLLTYPFVHIGLGHLLGNALFLLVVGAFAERKLKPVDFYSVYLLSAIYSALAFALLEPDTVLVGASAGVAGLMVAAFVSDLKRAVPAVLITVVVLGYVAAPFFSSLISGAQRSLASEGLALSAQLERLNSTLGGAQKALSEGKINESEYNRTAAEVSAESSGAQTRLAETESVRSNIERGYERERATRTSMLVHFIGGIASLAYIIAFRRDLIWQMRSRLWQ